MLMIAPASCSRITGRTCLHGRNALFKLTFKIWSHASSLSSDTSSSPGPIPTLLCSTSIRPKAAWHASDHFATGLLDGDVRLEDDRPGHFRAR